MKLRHAELDLNNHEEQTILQQIITVLSLDAPLPASGLDYAEFLVLARC